MQRIMSMHDLARISLALAAAFALAACAPSQRSDVYQYPQGMRAQTVEMGVIESVRYVTLGAPNTGVGTGQSPPPDIRQISSPVPRS